MTYQLFGSDNTCYENVGYTKHDCQATEDSAPAARPRTIARICGQCQREFSAYRYQADRGRARFCSPSCASRFTMLRRHRLCPQVGPNNPAWKGGISRDHVRYKNQFRAKFPEKAAAHDALQAAVRAGRLVRPARCSACRAVCKPHAHHDDYSKHLSVRWLCRPCHREADRLRVKVELVRQLPEWTHRELAEALGISMSRFYELKAAGLFERLESPVPHRYSRERVEAWVATRPVHQRAWSVSA